MPATVIAERIGWGPWPDDPEGQGRRVASGAPACRRIRLADDVPAREVAQFDFWFPPTTVPAPGWAWRER